MNVLVLSYFPLVLIFLAIATNSFSFCIFRFNKKIKKMSSMVYLSFVVLIDIFGLFTWNLDNFLQPDFDIRIESVNLITCRIFTFMQFFAVQSSPLLLCFVSIDRFISVSAKPGSCLSHLPFGTIKSAKIWSLLIIISIALINIHLIIFNGFYDSTNLMNNTLILQYNNTLYNLIMTEKITKFNINCYLYSVNFNITEIWNYVKILFQLIIPGTVMIFFNILLIYKIVLSKKTLKINSATAKSYYKKRKITFTLLSISFAYILMIFPGNIYFIFIYQLSDKFDALGAVFDLISFCNNTSVFFNCFVTNLEFRKVVLRFFKLHTCRNTK